MSEGVSGCETNELRGVCARKAHVPISQVATMPTLCLKKCPCVFGPPSTPLSLPPSLPWGGGGGVDLKKYGYIYCTLDNKNKYERL